jgi:transcriptional regulator with XRE-family HTH domain
MNIAERFRQFRDRASLNQNDVCEAIGINRSTWSSYESGRATPSVEVLIKLYEKYKINLHWLLVGQGEMTLDEEPGDLGALRVQLQWIKNAYQEATGADDETMSKLGNKIKDAAEFLYYVKKGGKDEK